MIHQSLPIVALLAVASAAPAAIISSSPHAVGGNRLYVGGLSWTTPTGSVVATSTGRPGAATGGVQYNGPPRIFLNSGAGETTTQTVEAALFFSLNGLPPGQPPLRAPTTTVSFFDVFVGLDAFSGGQRFAMELSDMELDFDQPGQGLFKVRESPTLASTGEAIITDIGGGLYRIDSFFDVFTELSLDNGQTWIPSDGPARLSLVPAPGTAALLGLGGLMATRRRRS
jgi:hypothetical protein